MTERQQDERRESPIADLINDGLRDVPNEVLEQMLRVGHVYVPRVPLQVSKVRMMGETVQ